MAMYSASVKEWATVVCAQERHEMIQLANLKKKPVTDHRVIGSEAQSESVYAASPFPDLPSYTRA